MLLCVCFVVVALFGGCAVFVFLVCVCLVLLVLLRVSVLVFD